MTTAKLKPRELTVSETAERLGRSNKTIHNMIADGRLSGHLVDAPVPYYMVTIASIEALEAAEKQKAEQSAKG